MLKKITICRSSHTPHLDSRRSPVGCRLVSQVVAFPVESAHLEESAAVDHLPFANLYRFFLQLEAVILLIFRPWYVLAHLVKCASVLSYIVLCN